ncbi:MAG TPA: hypothetical protein VMW55_08715 [Nitrosopumilaceae archaeon]|jgi:hypothetical protein|nr:hypothetical protein [Nitrosopumilaceae archaeon]
MNQLILESKQPESSKTLIESKVKEREKIQLEINSMQNICAMDVMGLSWTLLDIGEEI